MRWLLIVLGLLSAGNVLAEVSLNGEDTDERTNHPNHVLHVVPAPVEVTAVPELANCKVFMGLNGLYFKGIDNKIVRASGKCPSDYVDGKLIGTKEIEIMQSGNMIETGHRICTLTPNGGCAMIRFLDNPVVPSTTVFNVMLRAAERVNGGVFVPPDNGHILQVGPPSELVKFYAGDWSSCRILYGPDGVPFVRQGKLTAVSGNCPPHRFVPAKLIDHDKVLVGNVMCRLNELGTCTAYKPAPDGKGLPGTMPNNGTSW